MHHLATTSAGLIPNPPTNLFTPSLLYLPSSNWIPHWHVLHHAIQIQSIGIYSQYTVAELSRVTVLNRVQTGQACLMVSMENNAGTTNKSSTHKQVKIPVTLIRQTYG